MENNYISCGRCIHGNIDGACPEGKNGEYKFMADVCCDNFSFQIAKTTNNYKITMNYSSTSSSQSFHYHNVIG